MKQATHDTPPTSNGIASWGPVRRALLRSGVLGAGLTGITLVWLGVRLDSLNAPLREVAAGVALAFLAGLSATPLACMEYLARRRAPSRRRDLTTAMVTSLLASTSLLLILLQGIYMAAVISTGSPETGLFELSIVLEQLTERPQPTLLVCLFFGLPFGVVVVCRLRQQGVIRQVLESVLVTVGAMAVFTLTDALRGVTSMDRSRVAAGAFIIAFVVAPTLPSAYRLADAMEGWLIERERQQPQQSGGGADAGT
jgi:hypothetical protein